MGFVCTNFQADNYCRYGWGQVYENKRYLKREGGGGWILRFGVQTLMGGRGLYKYEGREGVPRLGKIAYMFRGPFSDDGRSVPIKCVAGRLPM